MIRPAAAPRGLPSWAVLVAALLLTALATWSLVASGRSRDRARFHRAAEIARERVTGRLQIYIALLRSTAGLVAVDPTLDRAQFATFTRRLELAREYPGIQGVGLTLRLRPEEVPRLEARMRAQGLPDFRVRPDTARPEYHAIVFLEPLDRRNRAALGFDMFTEPVRAEAMRRARDTGEPALSGRVVLVQEIEGPPQAGFLIYVPVYRPRTNPTDVATRRRALEGFAYAPFRADDLLKGIFRSTQAPDVELRIYDGNPSDSSLLHDSARPDGERKRALADTLAMQVAGRRWTMIVTPSRTFGRSSQLTIAWLTAVVGTLVSLLLFWLARARSRAAIDVARARDLLGQVLEQAPVAICVLRGPDHVFALANPLYRQLVRDDPIGRPVREVIPEAREQGFTAALDDVYRTGRPWAGHAVEMVYDRTGAGPEPAYFNVLYHPFVDDGDATTGVIAVAVEITAEVLARRDAESARQEAESANRAKSDFLAAMSHELRTPLNAIAGYAQLMELGIHGPLTEPQRESLERIQRSAAHLLSLINDVLNFAKLEAGRVEFDIEDVPLAAAVRDVTQMIEPQLVARRLACRVDVPEDLLVRADAEKLRQILLNLLSNAVKFTERGGITVDVRTPEHPPGRICLRVADTGVGIPTDRLQAIFDPFVQVNRTLTTPTVGTGLGLAISRDLAHGMGADLTVASVPGEGSTFSVVLPRAH